MRAGEVTEWLMVTVLKTVVGRLTASSNLALSARIKEMTQSGHFFDSAELCDWNSRATTCWHSREDGVVNEAKKCLHF